MQFQVEPPWFAALLSALLVLLLFGIGWWQLRRGRLQGGQARDGELRALQAQIAEAARREAEAQQRLSHAEQQREDMRERLDEASDRRAAAEAMLVRIPQIEQQLAQREAELEGLRAQAGGLRSELAELRARNDEQRRASEERLALLAAAEERLREQFQNLAQNILDDRAKHLGEQSQKQIGGLLEPLREQIRGFSDVMLAQQSHAQRERATLNQEIQSLKQLNQKISEDAINLTRALKGDSKTQGAWGELVLERLLEASGLQEGREFETQKHVADEHGRRARPDVVVHLPDDKDLVIDAKVSLTAYERYCSAETLALREPAMREHLASLRRHMDELGRRDYTQMDGVRSIDFVLMFVPVEAAFIEAVRADAGLYEHALKQNIALVSPSTLLATLRTVAHLWKMEQRNLNAAEIAKRGAMLYDHFASMVDELEQVGVQLDKAQRAQSSALRRLTDGGKGSVLLQVQHLRDLGVPARRQLPGNLIGRADGEQGGSEDIPEVPSEQV